MLAFDTPVAQFLGAIDISSAAVVLGQVYYLNSLVLHEFFDSWSPRCMHHFRILHPSAL